MTSSSDRLDRIETLLERFIDASATDRQASNERMTRIEQSMQEGSQRMTRIEQSMQEGSQRMTRIEQSMQEGSQRMTRIEQSMQEGSQRMTQIEQSMQEGLERLTRIEQISESNNRFLESFSTDLRRYTDSMNNLATRIDGVIATSNQDRQETNTRLGAIQRQVSAIASHLGV